MKILRNSLKKKRDSSIRKIIRLLVWTLGKNKISKLVIAIYERDNINIRKLEKF